MRKQEFKFKPLAIRLALCFTIATVAVFIISEGAFRLQSDSIVRAPQTIELVIPAGTAAQVDAGGEVPSIPAEMSFLQGDVLVVVNQDQVDHQLGPVWVPPGSSGRLALGEVENVLYTCSFNPTRYLGIDVRQPTTWLTRATALALAVPPTTMFLLVYSIVLFPLGSAKDSQEDVLQEIEQRAAGSEASTSATNAVLPGISASSDPGD